MRKFFIFLLFSTLLSAGRTADTAGEDSVNSTYELYRRTGMEGRVSYEAFRQCIEGYSRIEGKKKELITLIDFSKPSTEERFFVLDIDNQKILFSSHVSHGRNSGENYATSFSNESGSFKSSLGFYVTGATYIGRNGYSLVLEGLEKGINDKAKDRAIVIHGASYCDPAAVAPGGRLGRSLGCPALPVGTSRKIIDAIKEGAVLFIYAADKNYLSRSTILSSSNIS